MNHGHPRRPADQDEQLQRTVLQLAGQLAQKDATINRQAARIRTQAAELRAFRRAQAQAEHESLEAEAWEAHRE